MGSWGRSQSGRGHPEPTPTQPHPLLLRRHHKNDEIRRALRKQQQTTTTTTTTTMQRMRCCSRRRPACPVTRPCPLAPRACATLPSPAAPRSLSHVRPRPSRPTLRPSRSPTRPRCRRQTRILRRRPAAVGTATSCNTDEETAAAAAGCPPRRPRPRPHRPRPLRASRSRPRPHSKGRRTLRSITNAAETDRSRNSRSASGSNSKACGRRSESGVARSNLGRQNSKRRCRTRRPTLAAAVGTALGQQASASARVKRRRLRVPLRRRWSASCRSPRVRTTRPSSARHPSGDEGAYPNQKKSDTPRFTHFCSPNQLYNRSPSALAARIVVHAFLGYTAGSPSSRSFPGSGLDLLPSRSLSCTHNLALSSLISFPMLIPLPALFPFLKFVFVFAAGRNPLRAVHIQHLPSIVQSKKNPWTLFPKFRRVCPVHILQERGREL